MLSATGGGQMGSHTSLNAKGPKMKDKGEGSRKRRN